MTNPEERKGDQFWLRAFSLECIHFTTRVIHQTQQAHIQQQNVTLILNLPHSWNMNAFHLSGDFFCIITLRVRHLDPIRSNNKPITNWSHTFSRPSRRLFVFTRVLVGSLVRGYFGFGVIFSLWYLRFSFEAHPHRICIGNRTTSSTIRD